MVVVNPGATWTIDWAKEYGSGNSGEEGGWMPVGWRERVRRAAARAEEEERQAQRDLDEEARAEHAARTAAADLPGGGKLAVDGRTGAIEGEALCEWEGEESDAEHGADGGAVIEVRAYEMDGEARGDEARPEPRLQPRRRQTFPRKGRAGASREDGVRWELHGASERPGAAAAGAGGEGSDGGAIEAGRAAGSDGTPGARGFTISRQRRARSPGSRAARVDRKHSRHTDQRGAAAEGDEVEMMEQ